MLKSPHLTAYFNAETDKNERHLKTFQPLLFRFLQEKNRKIHFYSERKNVPLPAAGGGKGVGERKKCGNRWKKGPTVCALNIKKLVEEIKKVYAVNRCIRNLSQNSENSSRAAVYDKQNAPKSKTVGKAAGI